jgi:hypothetical protein
MEEMKAWTPPTDHLSLPKPPRHCKYVWLRFDIKTKKFKYPLVRHKQLKNKKRFPFIYIKHYGKCVGIEGLTLAKVKI